MADSSSPSFDTQFVELDKDRMVRTSDANYAIFHHKLPADWRTVSVNGDEVTIAARDGHKHTKRMGHLSADERDQLARASKELLAVVRSGPFGVHTQGPGPVRLTTYDRYGGTSTMGTSGSSSSSSSSSSSASTSAGGLTVTRSGANAWVASKSDFGHNWQRVFLNDDIVTLVYKDATVKMLPSSLLHDGERDQLAELKREVDRSTKVSESLLANPMDFVSKTLGNLFG